MIVEWLLHSFWNLILFILSFFPEIPSYGFFNSIISYIRTVFTFGSGLFFLFIPVVPFTIAVDVLFFFWINEPLGRFVIWILKKIPFLGIE